jgi:septal ring factor EnvC (AmiA/AmiB activator)
VRPNKRATSSRAVLAGFVLTVQFAGTLSALAETPPPGPAAELEGLREQSVAAAHAAQAQEKKLAALAHRIELLRREAEGRQRDLDESRAEQAALLGALEHLARNPPEKVVLGSGLPLDQARGRMLIDATVPELRAEARMLGEEIARVTALRGQIANAEAELERERKALQIQHEAIAEVAGRALALGRKLAPPDPEADKRIAKLARDAAYLTELIKQADAEAVRRQKDLPGRAGDNPPDGKSKSPAAASAGPSRPASLRAFDAEHPALAIPVAGTILGGPDASESPGNASPGLTLAAIPGATVVAPFDAQIIFAGKFRSYGPILILRHGGGYHSVLAGLGRLDVGEGQWVLAGEAVGAMPEAAGDGSGGKLYIELRRDGRPVDPQPWLANPGESAGRGELSGEQKVRE